MKTTLCRAQQRAREGLLRCLVQGNVVVLYGDPGLGKTTVLREIHHGVGGAFLTMKEFLDAMRPRHPFSMEETFGQMVMDAMAGHDLVIVDDLDLLSDAIGSCTSYPRAGFLAAPLAVAAAYASEAGKKLVFGTAQGTPTPVRQRSYGWRIDEFQVEDYRKDLSRSTAKKAPGFSRGDELTHWTTGNASAIT